MKKFCRKSEIKKLENFFKVVKADHFHLYNYKLEDVIKEVGSNEFR